MSFTPPSLDATRSLEVRDLKFCVKFCRTGYQPVRDPWKGWSGRCPDLHLVGQRQSLARSFEIIHKSLLQDDNLPFAGSLTSEHIDQALRAENISCGAGPAEVAIDDSGERTVSTVYTAAVTLWAMISQALYTGAMRSCSAAVQRVAILYAMFDIKISPTNTGAYTRARNQMTEGVLKRLTEGVALRCEDEAPDEWKWHNMRAMLVDGWTVSMPDTPENQAEYPQPNSQKPGLGFPMLRAVLSTSLATGMATLMTNGKYAGKETGETALLRQQFPNLRPRDLLVMDRYYAGWFMLALLRQLGVHFVARLHQLRTADFSLGTLLGKRDHIVNWPKPARPDWLDQETYDTLPAELEIREIDIRVTIPGFRTEKLVIVTSLLDHEEFTRPELELLYRQRWGIELQIRDIKQTLQLAVLRRKTPSAIRQELWTGFSSACESRMDIHIELGIAQIESSHEP